AAFDSPGWRFSIDWDGMRCLLISDGAGGLRIQDERMRDVTALFPDLAEPCAAALAGRRVVLDGVIAVLDREGRPDLPTLAGRGWRPRTGCASPSRSGSTWSPPRCSGPWRNRRGC